jgi:acyl carrier protein
MTRQEMLDQLAEIVEQDPGSISPASPLASLAGWDSLAVLGFIAAADKKAGVRLKAEQINACQTAGDLLKLVNL